MLLRWRVHSTLQTYGGIKEYLHSHRWGGRRCSSSTLCLFVEQYWIYNVRTKLRTHPEKKGMIDLFLLLSSACEQALVSSTGNMSKEHHLQLLNWLFTILITQQYPQRQEGWLCTTSMRSSTREVIGQIKPTALITARHILCSPMQHSNSAHDLVVQALDYLCQHNNKKTIFWHLVIIHRGVILQDFALVNKKLLCTWEWFFALRIFYLPLHTYDLNKEPSCPHQVMADQPSSCTHSVHLSS